MDLDHLTQGVALGYGGLGLSAQGKVFLTAIFKIQRDKAIHCFVIFQASPPAHPRKIDRTRQLTDSRAV